MAAVQYDTVLMNARRLMTRRNVVGAITATATRQMPKPPYKEAVAAINQRRS